MACILLEQANAHAHTYKIFIMIKKKNNPNNRQHGALTIFRRFSRQEAFGSILLLFSAMVAMVWANLPYASSYFNILQTDLGIAYKHEEFSHTLGHWVNDGLMAIFFFFIGLEIKREMLVGELSSLKKAALPLIAAFGGVLVPALLFITLNQDPTYTRGWAIPTSTDIAFSLGILMLLGNRVPVALKIFLAAFAIVDDIIAVLIISLFYSDNISWLFLFIGLGILAIMLTLNRYNLYEASLFLALGILVWLCFVESGVHATIAGVLISFTIPSNKKINKKRYVQMMSSSLEGLSSKTENERFLSKEELRWCHRLRALTESLIPPSQRLEQALHAPVAFLILPLFALANSGVQIITEKGVDWSIFNSFSLNIATSLVLGKIIGISLFSWLAVHYKIAKYPFNTSFKHILGASILGGFGFTMSLFINSLASSSTAMTNSGKVGIIAASIIAGLGGYIYLHIILPPKKKSK